MNNIKRILIANRGEIAVRIIRACRELRVETVLAISEADRESLAASLADQLICIGPARPKDSYLNAKAIVLAALSTGSNAIHPGYGFLAEQPELPELCTKYGLKFIGPTADTIRSMGDKLTARQLAIQSGTPVVPGSGKITHLSEALAVAEEGGFPIIIKAAAGGGGRGMKLVNNEEMLKESFTLASKEAAEAFGDPTLYVEKFLANARHIEVQVLGDQFGKVVYVGERDCSLQRRYQKIIEEAPAYALSSEQREQICQAGAAIARGIKYESAGTVEFMLDQDTGKFYFMEMNTRIQVEHPVTEMITGVDLVQEQIRIADGQPLNLSQEQIEFHGHAIECRINAEAAWNKFQPCPGKLSRWQPPNGTGLRVDSHCYAGYMVPPYYDSLIAKLIVLGKDRQEAIGRMRRALDSFIISGVETTIPFLRFLIGHRKYIEGKVNTRWVEEISQEYQTNALQEPALLIQMPK